MTSAWRIEFLNSIFFSSIFNLSIAFSIILGIVEFAAGLYDDHWTGRERKVDIICFLAPKLLLPPVVAFFSLTALPYLRLSYENPRMQTF